MYEYADTYVLVYTPVCVYAEAQAPAVCLRKRASKLGAEEEKQGNIDKDVAKEAVTTRTGKDTPSERRQRLEFE